MLIINNSRYRGKPKGCTCIYLLWDHHLLDMANNNTKEVFNHH